MSARDKAWAPGRMQRAISSIGLKRLRRNSLAMGDKAPAPLFIIGSGRSGNTLVRRVLMAGGEIFLPPETFVLGEIIEGWERGSLLTWRERVYLFCAYFEKHRFFPTFGLENLNTFAEEATAFPSEQRNLPMLLDAIYRHFAYQNGREQVRWGDKTPFNVFHLPALDAVFPRAQYLWLTRDGRDVALSYVEAELFDDHNSAAQRWIDANQACAAFATRKGQQVLRASYEDLVTTPEQSFGTVCDWAGLRFDPAMLSANAPSLQTNLGDVEALDHHRNVKRPISSASVGRWRDNLSEEVLSSLPTGFWGMMAELGYESAPS